MKYFTPPDLQNRKWLRLTAKAVGITVLAFVLSLFLTSPFSASTSALFSSAENKDFELSDLYAQVADDRPVRKLEDRVVVLDIANSNREEIADILEIVSLCDPRQVALDINFEFPSEDDSRLLNVLSLFPDLVLPLGVEEKEGKFVITDKPFFFGEMPNAKYGVINFPTKGRKGSIREFAVEFPMADGSSMPSLAMAVASGIDPDAAGAVRKTGEPTGIISYPSREIKVIHHSELMDRAEELIGKTVLVGSETEAGDVYRTPLKSSVSGLMIHAYALSTILDRDNMTRVPDFVDDVIAILSCFIIIFLALFLTSKIKGVLIRVIQVVFLFLAVRIGYGMYVDHHLICNFSHTLLMVAFGLFAVDIWNGGEYVFDKILRKINRIRENHKLRFKCDESC